MAPAYNEILLRQLFRVQKSPFPTHHFQQTPVQDIVGVIHRHFALPFGEQEVLVAFRCILPRQQTGIVSQNSCVHVKCRPITVGILIFLGESGLFRRGIFLQMTQFLMIDHRQMAPAKKVGAKHFLFVLGDGNR